MRPNCKRPPSGTDRLTAWYTAEKDQKHDDASAAIIEDEDSTAELSTPRFLCINTHYRTKIGPRDARNQLNMLVANILRNTDKGGCDKFVWTEPTPRMVADATAAGASYASEFAFKATNCKDYNTNDDMMQSHLQSNTVPSLSPPINDAVTWRRRGASNLVEVARAQAATDSHRDYQRHLGDTTEILGSNFPVSGAQMAIHCVKPKHQRMMPRATSAQCTRSRKTCPGELEDIRPKSSRQAFRAGLDASKCRAKAGMPVVPGTGYLHPDAAGANYAAVRPWQWSVYGMQEERTQGKIGTREIVAGDSPGAVLLGNTGHAVRSETMMCAVRAAFAKADELPSDGTACPSGEYNQCLTVGAPGARDNIDVGSPATGSIEQGGTPKSAASGSPGGTSSATQSAHQPWGHRAAPRQAMMLGDSQTESTAITLTPGQFHGPGHAWVAAVPASGTSAGARGLMLRGNYAFAFGSDAVGASSLVRAEVGRRSEHGADAPGDDIGWMSIGCTSMASGRGIARIVRGGRAAAPLFSGRARAPLLGSARAGASREYPTGTAADQLPRRWPPTAGVSSDSTSDSTIQAPSAAGYSGVQQSQS